MSLLYTQTMNRRNFLKGAGAVTVVVAGGVVWRSYEQGLFNARSSGIYEAWDNWKTETDSGAMSLVRAGILASNPHNTQPWIFKVTESRIELFADLKRNLGSFDPFRREMYLSLGCALENMLLSANAEGFIVALNLESGSLQSLGNDNEPRLVAILNLSEGAKQTSKLYKVIPTRHTNRGPYQKDTPLKTDTVKAFSDLAKNEPDIKVFLFPHDKRQLMGDLIVNSTEALIADEEMLHDSEKWMRHSWNDMKKYRSGISVDAAGLPPTVTAIAKILPPLSEKTNGKYWLNGTRDVQTATAALFGLIAVRDLYDMSQNLRAGRIWQRMHLLATSQGIAMHPMNQPVELVDREHQLNKEPIAAKELATLTGDKNWKPTFSFRAGYAVTEAKSSPRRKIEDVIV